MIDMTFSTVLDPKKTPNAQGMKQINFNPQPSTQEMEDHSVNQYFGVLGLQNPGSKGESKAAGGSLDDSVHDSTLEKYRT